MFKHYPARSGFRTALHLTLQELETAETDAQKRSTITTILHENTSKSRMILVFSLSDSSSFLTDEQFKKKIIALTDELPDELLPSTGGH